MRPAELVREAVRARGQRALRAGFRYVRDHRVLWVTPATVAFVGTLTYEFTVTIPLLAELTFDAGPRGNGLMFSAMGAGAVVGGLVGAARGTPSLRRLAITSFAFGAVLAMLALAPTLPVALAVLTLVGPAASTSWPWPTRCCS